jgi:hypothetical protein
MILPVALYHAWQVDGEIPDEDAPKPRSSTKAAKGEARKEDLLHKRRREQLAHDAKSKHEDYKQTATLKMNRNYRRHYDNVLEHCTALRIWASRSISPEQVHRAQECHGRACRSWADMNCHLTPNFHLAEHTEPSMLRYGPLYGYWSFPGERHNGYLKRFHHNGHAGGELEATMMRGWLKYSLVHDLVRGEYVYAWRTKFIV